MPHKGLVCVGGTPIVARQLHVLAPLVGERIVVAGDPTPYADFDARMVTDLHPGAGPLAGLESALAATTAESLLVFACDLPFIDAALVTALRDAPAADAVVARLAGKAQPLAARYARVDLAARAAAAVARQAAHARPRRRARSGVDRFSRRHARALQRQHARGAGPRRRAGRYLFLKATRGRAIGTVLSSEGASLSIT